MYNTEFITVVLVSNQTFHQKSWFEIIFFGFIKHFFPNLFFSRRDKHVARNFYCLISIINIHIVRIFSANNQ